MSGLTLTAHESVSPSCSLDQPLADLWRDLFEREAIQAAFVRAVRSLADGQTATDLSAALHERDIPAVLHQPIVTVARGHAPFELLAAARGLAWSHLGNHYAGRDEILATASLFAALEDGPSICLELEASFRDRRRDQREAVLQLVARLAQGLDVRVTCSGLTQRWLADQHREILPGVREQCSAHGASGPTAAAVDAALETLAPDGSQVAVLRALADAPGESLRYDALADTVKCSRKRLRGIVSELADLELVERFGPASNRAVDLLAAGRETLAELDRDIGRQATLDDGVCEPPKSPSQAVLYTREDGGGREPGRTGGSGWAGPSRPSSPPAARRAR